jgi:hypothetical protein
MVSFFSVGILPVGILPVGIFLGRHITWSAFCFLVGFFTWSVYSGRLISFSFLKWSVNGWSAI